MAPPLLWKCFLGGATGPKCLVGVLSGWGRTSSGVAGKGGRTGLSEGDGFRGKTGPLEISLYFLCPRLTSLGGAFSTERELDAGVEGAEDAMI